MNIVHGDDYAKIELNANELAVLISITGMVLDDETKHMTPNEKAFIKHLDENL